MLSYLEISKNNLTHNFLAIKSYIHTSTRIVSVLKANAYGHGLEQIAKILDEYTDYFQIDDIEELRTIRKFTKKPVLVLGYILNKDLEELVEQNGILGIYNIDQVYQLNKIALSKRLTRKIKIHICIDSALGRDGILLNNLEGFLEEMKDFHNIEIDAIYSHFGNIDDAKATSHTEKQINLYFKAIEIFENFGYRNLKRHISSTGGILVYDKNSGRNDLVRPGSGLYGLYPSNNLKSIFNENEISLKPVLQWKSHIAQIKEFPENYGIGYGVTFITSKAVKAAIIPQGYSDGYPRNLSNIAEVLISGKRCKVLGRISMNMMVVDISHIHDISIEDEVILIGKQHENEITADELANLANTNNLEIISRISPILPRIII